MKACFVFGLLICCIYATNEKQNEETKKDPPNYKELISPLSRKVKTYYLAAGKSVTYTSENYPKPYKKKSKTTIKIMTDPKNVLVTTCNSKFGLRKCKNDVLTYKYGGNKKKFCGKKRPSNLQTSNSVTIKFRVKKVNKNKRIPGFSCKTKAVQILFSCKCGLPNANERIVLGDETSENLYPWNVAVGDSSGYNCGGTLISDQWVLTAAHCTNYIDWVIIGAHNLSSPTLYQKTYAPINIINHPQYNSGTNENDIALIKLNQTVDIADHHYTPVCLPSDLNNDYDGIEATAAGWGKTGLNAPPSDVLLHANLTVINNTLCNTIYSPFIFPSSLCADDDTNSGKGTCQGDSGGPLIVFENGAFTQIGVVSFGYGCGGTFEVYQRVTSFMNWIAGHIVGSQMCNE